MATFGRKVDGKWLDVTTGPDLATVQARFHPTLNIVFQSVPDNDTNGQPLTHGATDNDNGTATNPVVAALVPKVKLTGLTYDEFRKLFTVEELTLMDSATDDEYLTAMGLRPLAVTQKASVRYLISEAQATGAGNTGINLTSAKMGAAIDAMVAMQLLAGVRKAEIVARTVKS